MANLIIKSSADNLVLQGSDASPAITVGATGTTTFAENVTLSGTANVYGAGTFPAGHVIQTIRYHNDDTLSTASTTFSTANKVVMGTITPQFANSDILISGHTALYANANASYAISDIYKSASDFTDTANLSGYSLGLVQMNDAGIWQSTGYSWLDTCSENSTSTKTYGISIRANNSGGAANVGWGTNGGNVMILQEIKR